MIEKNINTLYNTTQTKASSDTYFIQNSFVNSEVVTKNKTEDAITIECNRLRTLLIEKNRAYGNSALDPVRIFSRADNIEQLRVRIDDKISRFVRGHEYMGDNDIDDLMGYLILLKVAMKGEWK